MYGLLVVKTGWELTSLSDVLEVARICCSRLGQDSLGRSLSIVTGVVKTKMVCDNRFPTPKPVFASQSRDRIFFEI